MMRATAIAVMKGMKIAPPTDILALRVDIFLGVFQVIGLVLGGILLG